MEVIELNTDQNADWLRSPDEVKLHDRLKLNKAIKADDQVLSGHHLIDKVALTLGIDLTNVNQGKIVELERELFKIAQQRYSIHSQHLGEYNKDLVSDMEVVSQTREKRLQDIVSVLGDEYHTLYFCEPVPLLFLVRDSFLSWVRRYSCLPEHICIELKEVIENSFGNSVNFLHIQQAINTVLGGNLMSWQAYNDANRLLELMELYQRKFNENINDRMELDNEIASSIWDMGQITQAVNRNEHVYPSVVYESFVEAVYRYTQQTLASAGFFGQQCVSVYRSLVAPYDLIGEGEAFLLPFAGLEQWTLDRSLLETDENSYVVGYNVPLKNIFSLSITGLGSLASHGVFIFGKDQRVVKRVN